MAETAASGGHLSCLSGDFPLTQARLLHGGGGQVGVLVLELAVQSQASLLTVGRERGGDGVHFGEGGVGRHVLAGRGRRGELRAGSTLMGAQHHTRAGQGPLPAPSSPTQLSGLISSFCSFLQPLLFFLPPPTFALSLLFFRGTEALPDCSWPQDAKWGEEAAWGQLCTFPQGHPPACAGGLDVHSLPSPLLPQHLLF